SHEHIDQTLQYNFDNSYISIAFNQLTMSLEPIYYGDSCLDRSHANTLHMDPVDGNLWISSRHFDAIHKLDWENGGDSLMNLQDFALFDADYQPFTLDYDNNVSFFTHQHCIETYKVEGRPDLKLVSIFDNNNTPVIVHNSEPHSFGTLALINEALREAVIIRKKQLPTFCVALGTSQVLANGNTWYHCGRHESTKGWRDPFGYSSTVYEISTEGEIIYAAGNDLASY
ncbi:arylsulfotransferase, partial [Kipferlia bialata]